MRSIRWLALGVAAGLLAAGGVALAFNAEDDLAVVKKAVGKDGAKNASARPAGTLVARAEVQASEEPRTEPLRTRRPSDREAQWLRVRVVEKPGGKRQRVSVNLPLSLVRAVVDEGDGWPLDFKCGHGSHRRRCEVDLRAILRSLEAGQELVEVDTDEATVKVWVE